jgi:cytochrome b561
MQSSKRYHPALVTMHWLVALLVLVNLYLGIVVFENRGGGPGDSQAINPLVTIHMAVGGYNHCVIDCPFYSTSEDKPAV